MTASKWMTHAVVGLMIVLIPELPAMALQSAPPPSKIVRKNRAPVSNEVLRVELPKAVETVLENGLKVLILEDHRQPIVSVQLNISGAGGLFEPSESVGLAGVTAQMLRDGTTTRSKQEILEEVGRLGASLTSSSGFGSAVAAISASGLSRNMDDWFDVMLDVLLHPTFPERELEQQRQRTKVRLQQQRTSPGFLARERFNQAVFGDHPAAHVASTPESLDAMTTEVVAKSHRDRYAPQNAVLSIAGDVRARDIVPKLKQLFAEWERTELVEELPPKPVPAEAKKIFLVDRPNSAQTTIFMGNIVLDRFDPDYIALTVMNDVIGGGAASRLFINLREEKGYTYGAYSAFSALKYPGAWNAFADVRTEVTEPAMTEFLNEIQRIREEPVPESELDEVKRSIVAGFALSLEQPAGLLRYSTIREIYDFPDNYWDTYPARIMAVTVEDVQRVAGKYLDPDAMQVVAIGDAGRIKAVMEKFGPVEMYDQDGNVIPDQ
jgi:zinc protease